MSLDGFFATLDRFILAVRDFFGITPTSLCPLHTCDELGDEQDRGQSGKAGKTGDGFGILVADKGSCEHLKDYVDRLPQEPQYEEFGWGSRKVVDHSGEAVTSRLEVNAGASTGIMCDLVHAATLTVIAGTGVATVDGKLTELRTGVVMTVPCGMQCEIESAGDASLEVIEVKY